MIRQRWMALTVMLGFATTLAAQPAPPGGADREQDWRWGFFFGVMDSERLLETMVDTAPAVAKADTGLMLGLRVGADEEYTGWEASFATVLSDLDVDVDPTLVSDPSLIPNASNADLYLARLDFMLYPTGDDWAEGRLRPFISAGPGLGWFSSDFDEIDGELLYDLTAGLGFKVLLGDEGQTSFRFDYRWHTMQDFSGDFENMNRQEISLGFGFRF